MGIRNALENLINKRAGDCEGEEIVIVIPKSETGRATAIEQVKKFGLEFVKSESTGKHNIDGEVYEGIIIKARVPAGFFDCKKCTKVYTK